ncbi:MAG: Do family serine endopeptidase [Treponema sp.]|jgi:Do/DeqQ family serine protease|nr:Do family serine endopeptidase [Treponema sp.]
MNLVRNLFSKKMFIFNLVLIGVIFGFSLAFLSFSCAIPQSKKTAQAQETDSRIQIPQSSLAVAEALQSSFRSVADKVLPWVVEVKTVSVQRQQQIPFNGPWEFFFNPRNRNPNEGQEREYRSQGLGSGIIVRKVKNIYYVLTNNHVVGEATEISVTAYNGRDYTAVLVGKDERKDLAMISFETNDIHPVAELGDSDEVRVGDWSIAVGNPLGQMFSVTMGIVSAVGRTGGPAGNINDFIQTDASINQGNSGGPLVNIHGDVIGINTWIASNNSGGGSIGLGFAIPINNAKRSIEEFINKGEISYGWLGVQLLDPDREMLQALGLEGRQGAFISQMFLDSPAEKGGIRPGDFVTHVNGREIRGMNALTLMVGDMKVGERAKFTVVRNGNVQEFEVRIDARNDSTVTDAKKLWPGVYAVSLSDAIRSRYEIDKAVEGVFSAQVINNTPAATIGLRDGDIITSVNGEAVRDLQSFYRVLREKAGSELYFSVLRDGSKLESLKFKR